ncbi:MAG: hypothetical protein HY744_25800 [Deltaproteobacteria bacterium]|nr:hypothetical protein [Deltaproteobacteria bacterium]
MTAPENGSCVRTQAAMSEGRTPPSEAGAVLRHCGRVAETGDRWFVSVARGLARAGRRARGEAGIVAQSAHHAARTTLQAGRLIVEGWHRRTPAGPPGPSGLREALGALAAQHAARIGSLSDESCQRLAELVRTQITFELDLLDGCAHVDRGVPAAPPEPPERPEPSVGEHREQAETADDARPTRPPLGLGGGNRRAKPKGQP